MKKRVVSAILAVSMTASLCACAKGGKQENSGQNGTSAEQSGSTSAQTGEASSEEADGAEPYVPTYPIVDEPITVTGLVVDGDLSVSESRIVWDLVEEVTGINIEWINIDKEALSTYLAGNDWPDFFHTYELSSSEVNDYGVLGGRYAGGDRRGDPG